MNLKIMECIIDCAKNIGIFCNKLSDSSDPEKYASSVRALGQSVDETYAKIRELISQDESLSVSEKIEKLEKLAQNQMAAQQACEKSIQKNREQILKIATEIFAALATCGISCIPKVMKGPKKNIAIVADTTAYSELPAEEAETLGTPVTE